MVTSFVDSIIYALFLEIFLQSVIKSSNCRTLFISISFSTILCSFSFLINDNFNPALSFVLIITPLILNIFFQPKIYRKIIAIAFFFYSGFSYFISALVIDQISYFGITRSENMIKSTISVATFIIVSIVVLVSRQRISNIISNLTYKIGIISCCIIWLSGLLLYFFKTEITNFSPEEYLPVIKVFISAVMTLLAISLPIMISSSISKAKYKAESDSYKEIIENQIEYYNSLAQANHEFRKFRHDYKNLKLGLDALLEAGQYDEAKDFLESSDKELLDTVKNFGIETGNSIINGILASKIQMAKSVNATFDFFGYIPSEGIKAYDLCRIMGNILDNALEACSELPKEQEKIIRIHSQIIMNSDILILKVQNPSPERVINNNKVETTKSDKESHGFGISNVKDALKEYDGEMTLSYRNGKFTTEIHMKIKTDEE